MNVLIIEDEESAFENLKRILVEVNPNISIVDWLQSSEGAINWFKTNESPDLIFLDIHLSDDLSFKIFESVKVTCPIIFTTAYDQYAIRAFDLNSIDYLLKPITSGKVEKAISKYQANKQTYANHYDSLMHDLQQIALGQHHKERFLVNKADELIIVPSSDIAYFHIDKHTYLVTKSGHNYSVNFTLDELVKLVDPSLFYRANRQIIVNIHAIVKITLWFKGKLKLSLMPEFDDTVLISREKSSDFKSWMDQ